MESASLPNSILIGSAIFAWLTIVTTHRQMTALADLEFFLDGVTLGTRASTEGVWTERNFLVQWRRQDLARGGHKTTSK